MDRGWRHSGISVDEDKIRKDEDGFDDIDDFWKACTTNSRSGTPRRTFNFDNPASPGENDGLSNLSPMISSDSEEVAPSRRQKPEPVIEELPPTPVHSQSESLEDRMRQVTRRSPIFSGRKRDRSVFADEDVPKPNFDSPRKPGTGGKKPILAQIEDAHFSLDSDSGELEESPVVVKTSPAKKQKKKTDEEKLSQLSERRKQARARKETEFERPKPPLQLMEALETKQPIEARPSQRRNLIQVRNSDTSRSAGTPRPKSNEGRMPQPMQFSLSRARPEDTQAPEEESDEDAPLLKIVPATKKSTPEKRKGTPGRPKDEHNKRMDTPRPGRKPKADAQDGGSKRRDGIKDTPRPVRKTKETPAQSQLDPIETEPTKRGRKQKAKPNQEKQSPNKKEAKTRKPKFNWFSSGDELSTDDIVSIPSEPEGERDDDLPIALRRTRRVKVKPLRFWRGEKIVYKLADDDGLPCFGSVHRVLKRDEKK